LIAAATDFVSTLTVRLATESDKTTPV